MKPASAVSQPTLVLYDGICPRCLGSQRFLRRLDWLHRLEFLDLRDWPIVDRRFSGLDKQQCAQEMHVVFPDGRVRSGFDAVRSLLWLLPPAAILAPLLYIPGTRRLGQRLYRRIAARRRLLHPGEERPGT